MADLKGFAVVVVSSSRRESFERSIENDAVLRSERQGRLWREVLGVLGVKGFQVRSWKMHESMEWRDSRGFEDCWVWDMN